MAKASPLFNNFGAGEFGPLAAAQVDHPNYKNSLELCQNYVPTHQGGLTRRPGTRFVKAVKDSTKAVRLERFALSDEESYILEIGDLYFRFYKDGAQITSGGNAVEIVTPYPVATIFQLTVTSVNDALYIFHEDYGPRKLLRFSDTSWSLSICLNTFKTPFLKYPYFNDTVAVRNAHIITTTGFSGSIAIAFGSGSSGQTVSSTAAHPITGEIIIGGLSATLWKTGDRITVTGVSGTVEANGTWFIEIYSSTQAVLKGSVYVNAYAGPAGFARISPFYSTDVGRYIRIFDSVSNIWVTCLITAYTNPYSITADTKDGVFSTSPASWGSVADGLEGQWQLGLYSDTTGYPTAGCFHQDRLFLVGPKQYFAGSRTADYENFSQNDQAGTVTASHALVFGLNSNDISNCKWIHPDERGLLIGTTSGEWVVKSASSVEAISPTSIDAKQTTSFGSRSVYPVKAGKSVIFPLPKGRIVQELNYFYDVDGYRANNLTKVAHHIAGSGLVQLALQKEPQTIVWCVRSDGLLAAMTYERDVEGLKAAWHRHQIGGYSDAANTLALVESIAVIPSADGVYDQVWIVVKRWVNGAVARHIEYLTNIFEEETEQNDAYFVDSGIVYDSSKTITAITKATPPVVTSNAHGFSNGDELIYSDIMGMTELNGKRYFVANKTANTWEVIDENGDNVAGLAFTTYISGGYVRKINTTVSGLSHLEGQSVDIFGDGADLGSATVTGGAVTLPESAAKVHVGLGYQSKGKLPRLEAGSNDGTALGKTRRTHKLTVMLDRSRDLKIGTDFDNMNEIDFSSSNDVSGQAPPLFTGFKIEEFDSNYDTENQICFMQDRPLPSTLLAMLPQLVTQDR